MEESDLSVVSGLLRSTQLDEAETMPASPIPDMANSVTETSIPVAEPSNTALGVTQTSSSSVKQDPVVPVQGSSDEESSIDGGPIAPTPTSPDPISATSVDPAQSGLASENLSIQGSQSSTTPDPTSFETIVSSSASTPLTVGTSSQSQNGPLKNTNDHSPISTDIGSVEPGSRKWTFRKGNIGYNPAMQPTGSAEQASSSEPVSQTNLEAQGTLSINGGTQTSASLAEISDIPPSTTESQVEGLPEPAPSESPTVPGGEVTPGPILPEASVPSQDAAIAPPPTLEDSPKPSDTTSDGPTATWTTAPPDFTGVVVTNTAWTGDTLITTTSPGSDEPTVVPVFANCEGCGPGGSLVLFGVSIPLISYHLPKIPGLPPIPRFHLPCVLFCSSPTGPPPGSSSNQDNGKPPQPGPPEREKEKGEDEGRDDDKNDDQEDDQDNQDDEKDDNADDKNDDQEDDQDEEDEDEQSTTSQSSSATSSTSSSTESSTSTGTEGPVATETAYIDERPTDGFTADMDMNQYLLAAYSSLGIANDQFDSAALPTATAPTAMSITDSEDLVTASPLTSSSTDAMPTALSCASHTDPPGPVMEKSKLLGPTSIDAYGPLQTVGYVAKACGALADDTAPLAGGPFAGDHSYSATEPMESQSVHAQFVVSNNATVCESTEPTVGDCKKWFGTIVNMCGVKESAGAGRITDADCTVYDLSIEGEE